MAGPLKKPWGLCHGNAGNAYAFLKLHKLTKDEAWLSKAKQFAMHAIDQYEQTKQHHDYIRHGLWVGDMGLAVFLNSLLQKDDRMPGFDRVLYPDESTHIPLLLQDANLDNIQKFGNLAAFKGGVVREFHEKNA